MNAQRYNLTNADGLREWFADRYILPTSIERLNGGLMNFVWRVVFNEQSCIVKHGAPYLATAKEVSVDPARIGFEVGALGLFENRLSNICDQDIRPPVVLDFDEAYFAFVMEDVGEFQTLDTFLPTFLGASLGRFFGQLHAQTTNDSEFRNRFNNMAIQQTRLEIQYNQVAKWLSPWIVDADRLGKVAADFGMSLLGPGRCLIMGDAWLPSFLVSLPTKSIRVIDWEFCHFGRRAQDIGHLAAHLWLAKARGMTGDFSRVWKDFCREYKKANDWNDGLEREISIHAASEILSRTVGPFGESFHLWNEDAVEENVDFAINLLDGKHQFEL